LYWNFKVKLQKRLAALFNRISTKIVVPYFLLTLGVSGIGAFIVTNLVTGTLQERFDNQLLDAGRVTSENMVAYEASRLSVLRAVAGTVGVPEAIESQDANELVSLVPQIVANSNVDAAILLDQEGLVVYDWYKEEPVALIGEFSRFEDVRLVLDGFVDETGDRRSFLFQSPQHELIFSVGPVFFGGEQVGAVLIGTDVRKMLLDLTNKAIAYVTLYDPDGNVVETTLPGQGGGSDLLRESPQVYSTVSTNAEQSTSIRQIEVTNQIYTLAYTDWRLRGQSFGFFSVALPSNFIINAAATSRNTLSLVFSIATAAVFAFGYVISRRIVTPLMQLVRTAKAVSQGDLNQRTGIYSEDEIGVLATAFDDMTEALEVRSEQLIEEASKLNAILQSIVDGVIVFDEHNDIIASNPSAKKILQEIVGKEVSGRSGNTEIEQDMGVRAFLNSLMTIPISPRFEAGQRVFSALTSPVISPAGNQLGHVVVMRDITREVEAEERQNSFITGISHELRTPLTSIKGYTRLLISSKSLSEQQLNFAKTIDENTDSLINHVNQLIEIVEIQAGTLTLNKKRISFTRLVQAAVNEWREKFLKKDLSLSLNISTGENWVIGDPVHLTKAVDNLLQNSHDYTLAGGKVEISILQENNEICLKISDTGVGISSTDLPYIFSRFFRVELDETLDVPGLGLGLYLVRVIIEKHGGHVWAESEIGKGSEFVINLPKAAEI
jgi:two-component system sensor histidine kinase VicK